MQTSLFEYDLPQHFIAQQPAEPRDSSRLLVLHRATGAIEHRRFDDLPDYLRAGDLLVANDSRVIPARLHGHKASGGALEILLLRQVDDAGAEWECLIRGRGMRVGSHLRVGEVEGEVTLAEESGLRRVRFATPVRPWLDELGEVPLPPYISAWHGDPERYQTVYSRPEGSAAAPTAGLHFTPELLLDLRRQGVDL